MVPAVIRIGNTEEHRPAMKGFETLYEPVLGDQVGAPEEHRPAMKGFETFEL